MCQTEINQYYESLAWENLSKISKKMKKMCLFYFILAVVANDTLLRQNIYDFFKIPKR